MQDHFTTTITVAQSAAQVFNAINNPRAWWSEEIEGNTAQLGSHWHYHYQDVHRCTLEVTELVPNQKVVWTVIDNHFSFTHDKNEWKGNRIVFEISEKEGQTQLTFTQIGLVPTYECYDICEKAWQTYIGESLYNLITTGKGNPNSTGNPTTEDEKALSQPSFTTTFFVDQSPAEVYAAVNNVSGWWHGEVLGPTLAVGDEFSYRMKDVHYSKQRVTGLVPNEKVTWLVTDSKLKGYANPSEWTGTTITFEITPINKKTQLRFTHHGLVPAFECFGGCSWGWKELVQKSLLGLVTTGKGVEVFKNVE